jgi:hypothetical protein
MTFNPPFELLDPVYASGKVAVLIYQRDDLELDLALGSGDKSSTDRKTRAENKMDRCFSSLNSSER